MVRVVAAAVLRGAPFDAGRIQTKPTNVAQAVESVPGPGVEFEMMRVFVRDAKFESVTPSGRNDVPPQKLLEKGAQSQQHGPRERLIEGHRKRRGAAGVVDDSLNRVADETPAVVVKVEVTRGEVGDEAFVPPEVVAAGLVLVQTAESSVVFGGLCGRREQQVERRGGKGEGRAGTSGNAKTVHRHGVPTHRSGEAPSTLLETRGNISSPSWNWKSGPLGANDTIWSATWSTVMPAPRKRASANAARAAARG